MRDLSKVRFQNEPRRRPQISKSLLRIVVLVAVVAIVFNLAKSKLGGSSAVGANAALHEAPRGLAPVKLGGDLDIASDSTDLASQSVTLRDVKYGGRAQASAKRSFGGGTYILTVDATLPDPVNVNYAVWVAGGGSARLIDYMRGSGTEWSLTLRDTDKYSGYSGIWITLERTKDQKPEEHVMEGTF
ncbi:hypothetical protein A2870_04365 [Candidatus Curtissbacteria bacterium RIFCSPHIGHO2_01_FULL_41_11]|uniref:Uncharacterized protein n=1 Tax=Candidatus Curtissbacteria bacterium RIFCSPHIGHO2_01_FULL_41_11 TaxID=1797711 RepID=A0A1F5G531_9BACT|nr:MAG: hypothetical protein A2870_04365 [Candidatus Curtissbacteria bacterium RIFCSPHIGHO2_01_FULL_41_11]